MHHHIHPHNWWAVMIKKWLKFSATPGARDNREGTFLGGETLCPPSHLSGVRRQGRLIPLNHHSHLVFYINQPNTVVEGGGRGKVHIVTGPLLGRPEEGGHHMPHAQTSSHCWASRNLLQVHHHYHTWVPLIKYHYQCVLICYCLFSAKGCSIWFSSSCLGPTSALRLWSGRLQASFTGIHNCTQAAGTKNCNGLNPCFNDGKIYSFDFPPVRLWLVITSARYFR